MRQTARAWCLATAWGVTLLGCGNGTIGPLGSGDPDANPFNSPTDPSGTGAGGGSNPQNPGEPATPTLAYASLGTRCVGGELSDWLVLSRDPVDCEAHADFSAQPSDAFVRFQLPAEPSGQQTVRTLFCTSAVDCAERDLTLDISSFAPGERLEGAWSVDLGDRVASGDIEASRCTYEPPDNPARSIRLTDIVVNQGVAVPLATDGGAVPLGARNAPVVAGRDAVFQVGVAPEGEWLPRDLIAAVRADGEVIGQSQVFVDGASQTSNPETMVQVPVPGERMTEGSSVSVGLFEVANCVDQPGAVLERRFPATGEAELGARSMQGPFRVVLVPVRWNTDGSGRLPNLSSAVVQDFAEELQALYPVDGVDVTVRSQPIDYDGAVDPAGNGWSQLLNECLSLRSNDDPNDEVYYYCVFQPTADVREFCSGGCVAGIGPVPSASDTYRRGAIGISFNGSGVGTFVHEIGHALGRPHAPCGGADGADPNYPYSDGRVGVWGYDLISDAHVPPDHRDLMSYCGPSWISDYNYDLFFTRIESVYGSLALKSLVSPRGYVSVVVDADMSLTWGRSATLRETPEGDEVAVDLIDTRGDTIATTTGTYQTVTHIPGGVVMIPEPSVAPFALRIDGLGTLLY